MINLSKRSNKKELLDGDVPFDHIKLNMQELNTINKLLGGHRITLTGVKKILKKTSSNARIRICEIGCGGGDNLMMIRKWALQKNINVQFTGVDIKQECITWCELQHNGSATWICSDYKEVKFNSTPDIIFSSLFCHHFSNEQLAEMMVWMKENCSLGFFINDLQRDHIAYHSIRLLTGAFSKSYLVKNDAPLSVARGFQKKDWENIFHLANISCYSIDWKWAFRYLITFIHNPDDVKH
jgi:2-polyprenyl-3-methyl-5-hydroxy-6-metoxy-1,4-benzoquinol methylase